MAFNRETVWQSESWRYREFVLLLTLSEEWLSLGETLNMKP
jgi:hypothetical protein